MKLETGWSYISLPGIFMLPMPNLDHNTGEELKQISKSIDLHFEIDACRRLKLVDLSFLLNGGFCFPEKKNQ